MLLYVYSCWRKLNKEKKAREKERIEERKTVADGHNNNFVSTIGMLARQKVNDE